MLEAGSSPLQPSEPVPPPAVQTVALVVLHIRVVDCPAWTVLGDADRLPIAAGGVKAPTVTDVDEGPLVPPVPVQVKV